MNRLFFSYAALGAVLLCGSVRAQAFDPARMEKNIERAVLNYHQKYPNLLFYMDRDYNSNRLLFESSRSGNSISVSSRWLMEEKGGTYEAVTAKEKEEAYGHSVSSNTLTLTAVKTLPMKLQFDSKVGRPVAIMTVNGRQIRVMNVYFIVEYRSPLKVVPKGAESYTVRGYDVATGEWVAESFKP